MFSERSKCQVFVNDLKHCFVLFFFSFFGYANIKGHVPFCRHFLWTFLNM